MTLLTLFKSARSDVATPAGNGVPDVTVADGEAVRDTRLVEPPATEENPTDATLVPSRRRLSSRQLVARLVLPLLAMLLAAASGYLKWQLVMAQQEKVAAAESLRAATDGTIALLSYRPATVERDLDAAKSRLTGQFLDSYSSLIHDVVIPGAQQKQIAATATVPAAGSVSVAGKHAAVLLFVDQTIAEGNGVPTSTASSVRVSLDNVDHRWLISGFDPV